MTYPRHSGILLHPTSLPGPHGSGDLGQSAFHFVDWLVAGGQTLWQVLPLGGIGPGNSPYMSPSAFAGNELLIGLTQLHTAGWLRDGEIDEDAALSNGRVDYNAVRSFRMSRLRLAAERFFSDSRKGAQRDYLAFCREEESWLNDYALFMALESRLQPLGKVWQDLPVELVQRKEEALAEASRTLTEECSFWKFCQWCFDRQWAALKKYANEKAYVSSVIFPSSFQDTAPMSGRINVFSTLMPEAIQEPLPACRPITSAPPASAGATRSIVGTSTSETVFAGGRQEWSAC